MTPGQRGVWESYKPSSRQKQFHEIPAWSGRLIKGGIGGVGAGKSTMIENEQIELCMRMPNAISVATRKSQKRARFSLQDDYQKLLYGIATWNQRDEVFRFKNGHQLVCAPADDYNRFGSWEIASFFIQEAHEVEPKIFSVLCDRLRSPYGRLNDKQYYRGYIDARGVTSSHWINRDFIEKAWNYDTGTARRERADNPDFVYMRFRTRDNKENLPEGYEEALRRQHKNDINWLKVFLDGEVGLDVEGTAVFGDSWDAERHVRAIDEDPSLPILRSWDFGYRAPCVLWTQYTRSGRLLVLRELCPENVSTDELIERVRAVQAEAWPQRPTHAYRDYGDIAGEQIASTASATDVEKVEEAFHGNVQSRKARISDGLNVLRKLMRDGVKVRGRLESRFAIDHSCVMTIEALAGAYYYPDGPEVMDRVPKKGTSYDRCCDALRYVAQLVVDEGYEQMPQDSWSQPSREADYFAQVGIR